MSQILFEEPTSKSLLAGLRTQDPRAIARVSLLYGPLIESWARGWGIQTSETADVKQDVLVAVIRSAWQFRKERPDDSFRAWLATITRNAASRYRKKSASAGVPDPKSIELQDECVQLKIEDPSDSPEELSALHQRALLIVRDSCSPKTWEIFQECVFGALSNGQIAERFETTVENVRVIRFRILKKLRNTIELQDDLMDDE
jgi:RNA polymerase sigma-70 factor (ECF subfamily)